MHPRYSQPGLSRLVQRMEADGLVERRADPGDGRATTLVMTRAGRVAVREGGRRVHRGGDGTFRAAPQRFAGSRAGGGTEPGQPGTRDSRGAVVYRSERMIKYIGSKRRLVPVLGDLASTVGCARSALDLFTGTTRVAQEFKRRGMHVTAVDSARYAEVFAHCYVATDARAVDERRARGRAAPISTRRPGVDGYVTETFCVQSRFFQPFNGRRIDAIRDAIERDYARVAALPGAADQPDRGGRPGRLDDRRADGLREAVGAPLVPAARAASARAARRTGPGGAGRRVRAGRGVGTVRLRVPRSALQPAPLLHQLPHLGDARRVGCAGALRRRVQARRRP